MSLIYPVGNVVDGEVDFGKSLKIGSVARTVLPIAVVDGRRIPILIDEFGRIVTAGGALAGVQMVEGDVQHGEPDLITNFPVKVGGYGSDTRPVAVTAADRVNAWYALTGEAIVGGGIAHDTPDPGLLPIPIGGRARTATPTAVADLDVVRAYWDANGRLVVKDEAVHPGEDDTNNVLAVTTRPLAISTYAAPLAAANLGAATDINIKAAPGCLMALSGENRNAALRYMQIHNLAAAIGGGAVPLMSFPVLGGGGFNLIGTDFWTIPGLWLSTGIRIGWSTTMGTYTAATASEHTTNWQAV